MLRRGGGELGFGFVDFPDIIPFVVLLVIPLPGTVVLLPLVGVGGIATAEDAWARIRAGASLVQLYSAMVYGGPGLPRQIVKGLARLMTLDGFASIAEAVGSE